MSHPTYVTLLTALFVTTLIVSNIIAVKVGIFFGYFLPVAVIIFPLGYVLSDIITEVYGFSAMRRVIWTGFFCNLLAVAIFWAGGAIQPAPFYAGQDAYQAILGATPRILGASFIAYLIGEFVNSAVLARLKVQTNGKYLWLRTITSTIIGEGLDSSIFIALAFWGIFPAEQILSLVLTQWAFKVIVEVILTPVTYVVTGFLKKREGIDHYDRTTRFNPLPL